MVSVIVINYNTFKITCDCIASVIKYTKGVPYEIVLVDNASPTDDPDRFLDLFPTIKLVKSPVNGGFSKGNNLGIENSSGDVVLLLNSDTILTEDSISLSAARLAADPKIGPLTVRLTYPDGKLQHTARKFRTITNELMDVARPALKLLPYNRRADLMLNQYFDGDYDTWCDWVSGAYMMFRRELLQVLPGGKLDERYFMYGEDQLWCYQFARAGYKSYYYSATTVIHINNASTAPAKQQQLLKRMMELELELYKLRHPDGLNYGLFFVVFVAKERLRYLIKRMALALFKVKMR